MPSGGHARSGPPPDPFSLNSARKGLVYLELPAGGYAGEVPRFPLPPAVVYDEYWEDKRHVREADEDASVGRREREAELWAWAWRTPQAHAWAREPWRWHAVAMWVRTSALCETAAATAADKNSLHRFADQIGLSPAGLKENFWKIGPATVQQSAARARPAGPSSRDRFKVIDGEGAA